MGGLCGCKTRPDTGGCHSDRQTDQSTAADDLAGRDLPARTRKTAPLAPPWSAPTEVVHQLG